MKMHPSVTVDRIVDLIRESHSSLSNPGICLACGADADGCEPDAREYNCECCDKNKVYGAEELLLML